MNGENTENNISTFYMEQSIYDVITTGIISVATNLIISPGDP